MRSWREVVLLGSLVMGCGGPLPDAVSQEELAPSDAPSEAIAESEAQASRAAQWEPGTARRVKAFFSPSDLPAWMGEAPESLVAFQGRLAFAINRDGGLGGKELWLSDGTAAGTQVVKTFSASADPFGPREALERLTSVGSRLFFLVGDEAHGRELWTSDGTEAGTRLVKDLTPGGEGSSLSGLTASGSTLLFFRYVPETQASAERYELWRSDGTETGTMRVKELGAGASLSSLKALAGSTLFFVVSDPTHGTELWKSDGTQAGTGLVKDIYPGAEGGYPYGLRVVGSQLFFTAADPSHGRELWKSDGTEVGTVLVEDFVPGSESGNPQVLKALGRHLYFTTQDPAGHTLGLYRVRLDGAGRSAYVRTLPNPYAGQPGAEPSISAVAVAGTRLFFGMTISTDGPAPRDTQLWSTDGTAAGTRLLVRPLSLSDEFQSAIFPVGDSVLFSAFEENTHGLEPWVSNGQPGGTRLLRDIAPGTQSAYPRGFTRVGSTVFFVAHDETGTNALWVLPPRPQ
ncbi:MAG TPA: ELWxxDGT repeat protein [Myxococcaceae bacterium]|nr:ELWxxDGT repeat protein [Myxococcaceae bacterium]